MVDRVNAANKARRQVDRMVKANTTVKSEDEALVKSKDKTTVKSEHKKNPPLWNNSGYQEHRSCERAYITLHEAYNNINIVATGSAAKRLRIGPKDSRKPRNRTEHEPSVKSENEKNPTLPSISAYKEHGRSNRTNVMSHGVINDISTITPIPAVKGLRHGPKDMRKPLNRIEHELWHSRIVKVWASGDIYFWILSEDTRLGIRIGAKLGSKLKARVVDNIDDPREYTIEFALDGIRIKYGNDVIWHKSVAGLANAGDGKHLLEQLDRDLKAQGLAEESLSSSVCTAQTRLLYGLLKQPEIYQTRRLLN